jgi:hypothetical protein
MRGATWGLRQDWEACIDQHKEEGSDSYVDSCIDPSRMLKECMEQHQDYYNPVLVRAWRLDPLD